MATQFSYNVILQDSLKERLLILKILGL